MGLLSGEDIVEDLSAKLFVKNEEHELETVKASLSLLTSNYPAKPFVLVVGAGHGGADKGASANGMYDKDATLKIVQKIKKLLRLQEQIVVRHIVNPALSINQIGMQKQAIQKKLLKDNPVFVMMKNVE